MSDLAAETNADDEYERMPNGSTWASALLWQKIAGIVVGVTFTVGADLLLTGSWRSAYFWCPGLYLGFLGWSLQALSTFALVHEHPVSRSRYEDRAFHERRVAAQEAARRAAAERQLSLWRRTASSLAAGIASVALLIVIVYAVFSPIVWAYEQTRHQFLVHRDQAIAAVAHAEERAYTRTGHYLPFARLGVSLPDDISGEIQVTPAGHGSVYVLQWGHDTSNPRTFTHTHGERLPATHVGRIWTPISGIRSLARKL